MGLTLVIVGSTLLIIGLTLLIIGLTPLRMRITQRLSETQWLSKDVIVLVTDAALPESVGVARSAVGLPICACV